MPSKQVRHRGVWNPINTIRTRHHVSGVVGNRHEQAIPVTNAYPTDVSVTSARAVQFMPSGQVITRWFPSPTLSPV